jgi:hypothetical protein
LIRLCSRRVCSSAHERRPSALTTARGMSSRGAKTRAGQARTSLEDPPRA